MRRLESERQRLVEAIAAGGELSGLVDALKGREANLVSLRAERERVQAARVRTVNPRVVRVELLELAQNWRRVLASEPQEARPLMSKLLVSRVRFTPLERPQWEMRGQGTLVGLFTRLITPSVPLGMASPGGFEPALPA